MMPEIGLELVKGGIALTVTLVGLGVGWLVAVTLFVQQEGNYSRIAPEEAYANLRDITSNRHEKTWADEK
jgi:hypothetical protein